MNSDETAMSMEEARRLAVEKVRSSYGTFIRLGEGKKDDEEVAFRFPLITRQPRLVQDTQGQGVMDVRFQSKLEVGEIEIDGKTRNLDAPHRESVFSRIRSHEETIETAIRKALVSSSGRKFSHLPFLENQYSPLEDLLSELILQETISLDDVNQMDEDRNNPTYLDYVRELEDIDLVEVHDEGEISMGSALVGEHVEYGEKYEKTLNEAMGLYFEHNVDEFDMIFRTLGPYLVIAGRYYQRAIDHEELPVIHEQELRDAVSAEYTGRKRRKKLFKFSRYLIQLQEVGILKPAPHDGDSRMWEGAQGIRDGIEDAAEEFEPLQEFLYTYADA